MKTQILVYDDKTGGAAPIQAEIYVEGERLHITVGEVMHISLYDDDVLRAFDDDMLETIKEAVKARRTE